jgi:hypothetical protein
MHDNGCYVKFEENTARRALAPGALRWTKKIRRVGFRFVHRFR